jgi:hypothetical protein
MRWLLVSRKKIERVVPRDKNLPPASAVSPTHLINQSFGNTRFPQGVKPPFPRSFRHVPS